MKLTINSLGIKTIFTTVLAVTAFSSAELCAQRVAVSQKGTGPYGTLLSPSPSASPIPSTNDPQIKYQWAIQNIGAPVFYAPTHRAMCKLLPEWQFGWCAEPQNQLLLKKYISGYYLADIQAAYVWRGKNSTQAKDCSSVRIGVVDTGIDATHPDLGANINVGEGRNFTYEEDDISHYDSSDWNSHGTLVGGIIGAIGNNKIGISGVCWKADITPIVVFDANGYGAASDMAEGIMYAAESGIKVINTSFQLSLPEDESGQMLYEEEVGMLRDAVATVESYDALLVAAAGNSGNDNDLIPVYPASFDSANVISVAASDNEDKLANLARGVFNTNYGLNSVDLAAPGFSIYSTLPTWWADGKPDALKEYDYASGSSLAAPFVSAVAASVWTKNPGFSAEGVKNKILASVDFRRAMQTKIKSSGRLNYLRAMRQ